MTEQPSQPRSSFVLYETEDGRTRVPCRFEGETLWLAPISTAELSAPTLRNISRHLKAICDARELVETATCKPFLQVCEEGSRRIQHEFRHHCLPAIFAVGHRVRSARGTRFRRPTTPRKLELAVMLPGTDTGPSALTDRRATPLGRLSA